MNEQAFDSVSRRAAAAITRRTSLMTIGAAGLAALAGATTVDAKKNKEKKENKADKKAKKECLAELTQCTTLATQCAAQVDQCTAVFSGICGGDPDCTDQIACCSFLASCDANGFFACLVAGG